MVDSRIGPYKIIREIGADRFGQVFEAVDSTRNKHVIIKSLGPEAASRPEVVSRLYSQAQTLTLLNHPHIARLIGFIRLKENLYLVMEFVEGESLRAMLKERGRLDPHLALAIFHQIMAAVKFAHELGVIHGDLKPSNIMVSSFAHIKLLDFAIAPILGDLNISPRASSVAYMAPERIRGEPGDMRSDIYSLGVILYESIVGRTPAAGNAEETAHPATSESSIRAPSLLVAHCPKWLDAFLLRALAASPDVRFPSVAAMAQAMGPAAPARSRRISLQPALALIRHEIQRMSSMPSSLLGRVHRLGRGLAASLNGAVGIARQKQASAIPLLHSLTAPLRRFVKTVNPEIWTKTAASRIHTFTQGLDLQCKFAGAFAIKVSANLRTRFTGFAENNWKRYAVLATLLISVLIETFIFGGANTLLSPDFNATPDLNRNSAAQSILEPLNPGPPPALELDEEPEPQPKVVNRNNRGTKISGRTSTGDEGLHHGALNSRRTVTYRVEAEKEFNRPTAQDVRVTEPVKRNPENNSAKPQLNVRWEN